MGTQRFSVERCDDVPAAAALHALDSLLSQAGARLSERNRRFLSFVVAETIAGRGHRIKAYAIGVDVFGRGEDFDPTHDPIVRIQATRLRAALAAYYEGPGARDDIRIVLRPGSYVPAFERPGAVGPGRTEPGGASVAIVVRSRTDPGDRGDSVRGDLMIDEVIRRLAGGRCRVLLARTEGQPAWRSDPPPDALALDIAVRGVAGGRRYSWSLSDLRTGEVRSCEWADQAEDGAPDLAAIGRMAAAATADVLAALSDAARNPG